MNEKQRAAFENWAKTHHGIYNIGSVNGIYSNQQVSHDWFLWQATIASVVVELPCWSEYDTPRQAIEACADRIKDAGVKHNDE